MEMIRAQASKASFGLDAKKLLLRGPESIAERCKRLEMPFQGDAG
jgi:hypothetical protein